ncbi:MAG: hypothetical protein C5B50_00665 [Verrucomicrobia bacterium]|nr:MAG: hypothetical protein C5B50_00665 [Verrucomicrobiota bacterium]
MTQDNQPAPVDYAGAFTAMAARIGRNLPQDFAGACVIVPPINAGDMVEILVLDPRQDPVLFWSSVETRANIELQKLKERQHPTSGWR